MFRVNPDDAARFMKMIVAGVIVQVTENYFHTITFLSILFFSGENLKLSIPVQP